MKIASHSEDIDGIVSAALLLKVFPDAEVKFLTAYQAHRTDENFDVVADLFKPRNAKMVIDHHETNLQKLIEEGRLTEDDLIDPKAPSAAYLVAKKFNLDDEISRELVEMANKADSGELEGSLLLLDKLIKENVRNQGYLYKLAKTLSIIGCNFEQDEWLSKELRRIEKVVKKAYEKINEIISLLHEKGIKFVIFDAREVPFYVAKDFASRLVRTGGNVGISIYYDHLNNLRCSIRISKEFDGIKANEIASKLGGGGHEKAAGCVIRNLGNALLKMLEELSKFGLVCILKVKI